MKEALWNMFRMLCNERGEIDPTPAKPAEPVIDPALEDPIEDPIDDPAGGLEIDLDEPDPEPDPAPDNAAFAAMRVENKDLKATVDELKNTVAGLQQPAPAAQPAPVVVQPNTGHNPDDPSTWSEADWDDLAKKDWKKAVDLRSEIKAKSLMQTENQTSEFNKVLEESKVSVLKRHPELNDPNSEKAKVYRNIVTANPDYTNQKKGPLSAMYEMEDYMEKNMGYKREDIVKAETKAREDEAARLNRVQLTSTTGHNVTTGSKVVLSKDEVDFCELQGIDPKTYASNKKKLETSGRGGIQL